MSNAVSSLTMENSLEPLKQDGDIELLELIRSVIRTWKHWVVAVAVVTLLYIAFVALQIIQSNKIPTYHKAIKFTFAGVEKSTYPNNAPFLLEDIIAPAVLNDVYETNDLDSFGLNIENFRKALLIEPYAPQYAAIVQKYNNQLSKNLSAAEIEVIQSRMAAELSAATNSAALLSLSLAENNLPAAVIGKVLSDIPANWAERATKDKGVLSIDLQLATSKSLDDELIQTVDYMVISDLLQEKIKLLEGNINKLFTLEGAATASDPVTGLKLTDLQQGLSDLRLYVIDELMSPIRSLGLTRNLQLSLYYYEDKRQSLKNAVGLLQTKASVVKQAFNDYYPADKAQESSVSSSNFERQTIPSKLNTGVIDKLLEMSEERKSEEFRQSMIRQWLDLNMEAAKVESQVIEVDRLITALNGTGENTASDSLKKIYLARAEKTLPAILEKLRIYFDTTQRIYQQLGAGNIGVNGHLYRPITTAPFVKVNYINIERRLFILIALLFLTTVIVVPVVMIRNALRGVSKGKKSLEIHSL